LNQEHGHHDTQVNRENLQQEREVVAQWKQEGFLEQLYLPLNRNEAILIFKGKTEDELNHLMTTLPFYALRKSMEVFPMIAESIQ
jgi:hypothetical protein